MWATSHAAVVQALLSDARVEVNLQNKVSCELYLREDAATTVWCGVNEAVGADNCFQQFLCTVGWIHCSHLGQLQRSHCWCTSPSRGCQGGGQSAG